MAKNTVSDAGKSTDEESSRDASDGTIVDARLAEGRIQTVLYHFLSAMISVLDIEWRRLTFKQGPRRMILKELKLLMTSLGTPLPVNMVVKKLAELPILRRAMSVHPSSSAGILSAYPLSFQYCTGKKQNMPVACMVLLTSSTNSSV